MLLLLLACQKQTVYFSGETDIDALISTELDYAQETVDVAIYTFTSTTIRDALINAHERGVALRVIADSAQTTSLDDQQAIIAALADAGVPVTVTSGFAGGIMHNKFIIIDGDEVLTGSYNFTESANHANDENLLILFDKELAEDYTRQMDAIIAR